MLAIRCPSNIGSKFWQVELNWVDSIELLVNLAWHYFKPRTCFCFQSIIWIHDQSLKVLQYASIQTTQCGIVQFPAGPAHSRHEYIAEKGNGAYSHWRRGLNFVAFAMPGWMLKWQSFQLKDRAAFDTMTTCASLFLIVSSCQICFCSTIILNVLLHLDLDA